MEWAIVIKNYALQKRFLMAKTDACVALLSQTRMMRTIVLIWWQLLTKHTRVRSPTPCSTNLLALGCGEGKCSVYCRCQAKSPELKRPNSLQAFRDRVLKTGRELYDASVQFSLSVLSDSLRSPGVQHARLSCPSPTPQSLLKLMSIGSVMPPNHHILCHPLMCYT